MTFLTSIAVILLSALLLGSIMEKIKLPSLLGMLIVGIMIGPYMLDLIAPEILDISPDLRELALIVILTRAGFSLNLKDMKKIGREALLMSMIPALFEIGGIIIFGTLFLNISVLEAAIMGAVIAAVSPAVVVPRMLRLKEQGYGADKKLPELLIASASIDDIFVILLFTSLVAMGGGSGWNFNIIWEIPASIILGISIGGLIGIGFARFFKKLHIRDSIKVLVMLGVSFLFIALEELLTGIVPFSGLLAVISLSVAFYAKNNVCAERLSQKFSKIWIFAEILLFVLVGAEFDISYATLSFGAVALTLMLALIFRMAGVFVSLIRSPFNYKERLFAAIAYIPKATVQAAIGGIPLAMGLPCGTIVLTAAVISILITAPLGAFATDITYKKLLTKSHYNENSSTL